MDLLQSNWLIDFEGYEWPEVAAWLEKNYPELRWASGHLPSHCIRPDMYLIYRSRDLENRFHTWTGCTYLNSPPGRFGEYTRYSFGELLDLDIDITQRVVLHNL